MTEENIDDQKKNSFILTKVFLWIIMLPLMLVRAIVKYEAFGYAVKGILILVIIMGFPIKRFFQIAIKPYSIGLLLVLPLIDLLISRYRDKKEEEAFQLSQYYETFLYEKLNKDLIQLNLDKLIPQNFNSLPSNSTEKSSIWEDLFNKSWTKIKNYQDKN